MTTQIVLLTTPGNGSLVVPSWALFAKVEVWGGGGIYTNSYGGGGGGYSRVNVLPVTPNATMNYHVAVAGQVVNGTAVAGSANSWFGSTSTCLANSADQNGFGGSGANTSGAVGDAKSTGGSSMFYFGTGGGGSASPSGAGGNNSQSGSGNSPGGGASVLTGNGQDNVEGGSGGQTNGGNPGGGHGPYSSGTLTSGRGQIRVTFTDEVTLNALTPTTANVDRNAGVNSTVLNLQGGTFGSTITLANDDGGRFNVSGSTVRVNGALADGARTVVVRESHPNGTNSPNDTTLTINVGDYVAPTITSNSSPSVAENTVNPTGTLTANETVTWSKNGGADQALFSVTGDTWTLNATPDFETKPSYQVIWRATDANGNGTNQTMTLTVTNQFEMGWNIEGPFYDLLTDASGNWTVPAGFMASGSSVECIGRGGNGGAGTSSAAAGGGGAGGYSKTDNLNVTAGSVLAYQCGAPTALTGYCSANGGGAGGSSAGGTGASISGAVGDIKRTGGNGRARVNTTTGGDGGSAGSASGNGANGSTSGNGTGAAGPNGTQWGAYGGSGGGGYARNTGSGPGGVGGNFGGGGGGGRGTAGVGGPGAILITYNTLLQTLPVNQYSVVLPGTGAVSWTPPTDCFEIVEARVWGPGGNGGSGTTANGGAGGAFVSKTAIPVTPGVALSGFIGSGGSNTASWFISDTTLKAAAGPNSTSGNSGTTSAALNASIGETVRRGGNGGGLSTAYTKRGYGGGGSAGTANGNGNGGGSGSAGPSTWTGANGGSAVQGGAGGNGAHDVAGKPGGTDPRGGGGGGGGGNTTGGAGGFPGGGGGGGSAAGAHGSIEIIYKIAAPVFETVEATVSNMAAYEVAYADAREGLGAVSGGLLWTGQYFSGSQYEICQTFLDFDLSYLPYGDITNAKIILDVVENYGSSVIEAREHAGSFIPGTALASKPLMGTATISGAYTGSFEVPGSLTYQPTYRVVLTVADQRTGTLPDPDDTFRITGARLVFSHNPTQEPPSETRKPPRTSNLQ